MIVKNNFMGLDGFVWWFGVVENRKDPLTLGRCQVRIFGWHTEEKNLIPTKDLPWAHPIVPLGSNAASMVAPKEGEMVFGFFLDGNDAQFPAILGIVPGIPDGTPRIDKGFSDPRDPAALSLAPKVAGQKTYSTDGRGVTWLDGNQSRFPNVANEPTVSRLARNENIDDTIIGEKKKSAVKNILTATEGYYSEPPTTYNAQYPYNHVYESESGHVMEFDDTPNAERIHIAHRSGTFDEMFPDGTRVTKVVRDKYEIVMSDNYVYVMGDCNITINGRAAVFVQGNADLKVGGNMKTSVQGSYEVVSTGNMKFVAPRIDFNPPGETPTYREQIFKPEDAIILKRQVPGGTGSFEFAGVTLEVSPNLVGVVPGFYPDNKEDAPPPAPSANVEPTPPVTCGDFSDPLTDADYNKNLTPNFKLRDLTIAPTSGSESKYRIQPQFGFTESDIACNLQALAENCLEPLLKQFPGMKINSAFRLGQDQGPHGRGFAADVSWQQMGKDRQHLLEVCKWAAQNLKTDQVIYEVPDIDAKKPPDYPDSFWLHISFIRASGKGQATKTGAPATGNRSAGAIDRLLTFRGGKKYYTQSEINWNNVKFAPSARGGIRPVFT